MEKDLIDLCKYLIGYILRENDQLKKENKELLIKQSEFEAKDALLNEFANTLMKQFKINDDEEDDEEIEPNNKFAA